MKTYEERAQYILKQRDERLAKRRRIRSAVTMSVVSVCSLALIVGVSAAINSVVGKNGVRISPSDSTDPSGGGGAANSQVTTPPAELVSNLGDIHSTYKFTMPEFPDVEFAIDNGVVTADGKQLFGGRTSPAVFLADLNGDGCRELCTDWGVSAPTTPLDMGISAYDYSNGEYYALWDPTGSSEYHLSLEDGKLKYKYYIVLKDQSIERKGEFTLSDMTRVSDGYFVKRGEALPAEKVYDEGINTESAFEFTMPEFPGVNFKVDRNTVSANGRTLYSGMPISTVYLADLNGDGYREICSEIAFGSGMIDIRILAYDYAISEYCELYELSDRGKYDYTLVLEDDVLKYKRYAYPMKSGDTPEEEGALTLSIMKRIEEEPEKNTAPEPEKVYDRNDRPNSSDPFEFTMPEFPGVNFKVENDAVYADGKPLYSGMSTVYLADLNGDGCRELCSDTAIGSGILVERIFVYDYANKEMFLPSDEGNYTLALEDGILKYKRFDYPAKPDDTPEEGTLTLSMMTRIPDNGSESSPPVEKLYPRDNSDIEKILELNDNFEFTIPELPETSFKLVKGVLSRDGEFLHQGYPIHSIYLADLNGDGVREICAEYSIGYSGVVDMNIFVYDPKAKESYKLTAAANEEYVLTLENGVLGYKHCVYSSSGITTDEQGELTLSVMNRLCSLPLADPQP